MYKLSKESVLAINNCIEKIMKMKEFADKEKAPLHAVALIDGNLQALAFVGELIKKDNKKHYEKEKADFETKERAKSIIIKEA